MTTVDAELERLRAAFAPVYRVAREVGRGGMATVLLADDQKHGRQVALKVLRADVFDRASTHRFLREIALTAQLVHPHILPLLDSGEVLGLPWYAMPYIEGGTLRDRLARDGQLPVAEAVAIAREVADALAYAHAAGVLHRDVKPANIMLAAGHALLADLGIAKAERLAVHDESRTETGLAVGTLRYMSPEQVTGSPPPDGRSDVYSLGIVLREMLDGGERPADAPAAVRRAIACALAFEPRDRFQSAAEMADALQASLAPAGGVSSAGVTPAHIAAYEPLLQGRFFWNRRTNDDARRALACFAEALRLDPACAAAHAGAADVWAMRAVYGAFPPHQAMEAARAEARAALAIDPTSGEARTSHALVLACHDWSWGTAEREFAAAIAANEQHPTAYQWLAATCLTPQRRFDEAAGALRVAIELDPISPILRATLAGVHLYERRFALAQQAAREAIALDARCVVAHYFLSQALVQAGRPEDGVASARRACELSSDASETLGALGHALGAAGDARGARRVLRTLDARARARYVPQTYLAQLHLALGEHDRALARLEAAADERAVDLIWAGVKPSYAPLRSAPRFGAVLERMGLPRERAVADG